MPRPKPNGSTYLRTVFSSLLITGPFSIVLGFNGGLMALNDRLKLRSMVTAEKGDLVYIASEEAAIRAMEPDARNVWAPTGGEPVIVRVEGGEILMAIESYLLPEFEVVRQRRRGARACRICEKQCANGVHTYDAERRDHARGRIQMRELPALRCALPDARAQDRQKPTATFRENANWKSDTIRGDLQAGRHAAACCSPPWATRSRCPVYWDRLLINASQVTNPSIDPLREPMETRVFLGKKPDTIRRAMTERLGSMTDAPAAAGAVRAHPLFRDELRLDQL